MADKRGFWLSVLGALAAGSGFLVLQFVRLSRQEPGSPQIAWITVGAMVVTLIVVMVAGSAGIAWIAGWARRDAYLRSMGTWDVVAPALRTDRIAEDLRRLGRTERRMPWGLTVTANSEGIGFWGGRSQITCELWLPRENVLRVYPSTAKNGLQSLRALGIGVLWGGYEVRFDVPIAGSFPFGSRPATAEEIERIIDQLKTTTLQPSG